MDADGHLYHRNSLNRWSSVLSSWMNGIVFDIIIIIFEYATLKACLTSLQSILCLKHSAKRPFWFCYKYPVGLITFVTLFVAWLWSEKVRHLTSLNLFHYYSFSPAYSNCRGYVPSRSVSRVRHRPIHGVTSSSRVKTLPQHATVNFWDRR